MAMSLGKWRKTVEAIAKDFDCHVVLNTLGGHYRVLTNDCDSYVASVSVTPSNAHPNQVRRDIRNAIARGGRG